MTESLRFPPVSQLTVRADFKGGALSSDFEPLILQGVGRQIGLVKRLAGVVQDTRHVSYVDHPLQGLLAQRVYQFA